MTTQIDEAADRALKAKHRGLWALGAGDAAVAAAAMGAVVVASDLTPELIEAGRLQAAGLPITWDVADAEALPYADGEFDAVVSCVGVMFAPHHQTAADELVRVCRPGGTISVLSWTPEGFVGQMFATMKPYAPPPPAGTQPDMADSGGPAVGLAAACCRVARWEFWCRCCGATPRTCAPCSGTGSAS